MGMSHWKSWSALSTVVRRAEATFRYFHLRSWYGTLTDGTGGNGG